MIPDELNGLVVSSRSEIWRLHTVGAIYLFARQFRVLSWDFLTVVHSWCGGNKMKYNIKYKIISSVE